MSDLAGNLLLVDDDMAKRYVLATWLRRAGHTVTEVGTGEEALSRVAAAELVLLDVNLPDISGFEVCRLIKSAPQTAAIPVIQVSSTAVAVAAAGGVDLVLTDLIMPGVDGGALLERLPAGLPTIVITGLDVPAPPRASALLHKGELTRERLAFAIRGAIRRHDG